MTTWARGRALLVDLAAFTASQAAACVFPFTVIVILAASRAVHVPGLHRYDLILLACLAVQAAMILSRLETLDELKVICVFHVLGLALELYKTHVGSWSYPEAALSKLGTVPLYSGFMYASVASYMCQSWRRLKLELVGWSRSVPVAITASAIYLNFFTHHVLPDMRWLLAALMSLLLLRSRVTFEVRGNRRSMPIVVAMLLIGTCVWIAENIATYLGAWQYPHQALGWHPVHPGKIDSWALLAMISFIVVAELKHVKDKQVESRKGKVESGLQEGSAAMTAKDVVCEVVRQMIDGDDYTPLVRMIADLSPEDATRKPAGSPYSVATQAWHAWFWINAWVVAVRQSGDPFGGLDPDSSWPEVSPADWPETRERLRTALRDTTDIAADDDPARTSTHDQTVAQKLIKIAVHTAYHIGQIALIRQELGLWPPEGGE